MRKFFGWLLVLVGAFALTAAGLLRFYALDEVKRTPLTVRSVTDLTGTADRLDPATGETELYDVKVTSVTETDDEASDEEVAVFVNTVCVVKDEPGTPDCVESTEANPDDRLITASTDIFATDRETALAIEDEELLEEYLPADAEPHEGLVNKWPFDAEQKDYPFWDGVLGRAVTAEFTGTETIDGLEVYVYEVDVDEEEATVVPGDDGGIQGLYSTDKTIKIDPVTGAIISQEQREVRTLPNGDPLIELDVAYTDEEVAANVSDAEDGAAQLQLVGVTGPLIGLVLGLVAIAAGAFLLLSRRRDEKATEEAESERGPDFMTWQR